MSSMVKLAGKAGESNGGGIEVGIADGNGLGAGENLSEENIWGLDPAVVEFGDMSMD